MTYSNNIYNCIIYISINNFIDSIDINNGEITRLFNTVKDINNDLCSFKLTTNDTFRRMYTHIEKNEDKIKCLELEIQQLKYKIDEIVGYLNL